MSEERFNVTWECNDGYAGGSAPQHLNIRASDLEPGMTDEDLSHLFWELVQEDFAQKCSPVSEDEEKFIAWAKEQIKKGEVDDH